MSWTDKLAIAVDCSVPFILPVLDSCLCPPGDTSTRVPVLPLNFVCGTRASTRSVRGRCDHVADCLERRSHLPLQKVSIDLLYIDGLVQDCSISSTLAMEILQSYTKPLIYYHIFSFFFPRVVTLIKCRFYLLFSWFRLFKKKLIKSWLTLFYAMSYDELFLYFGLWPHDF